MNWISQGIVIHGADYIITFQHVPNALRVALLFRFKRQLQLLQFRRYFVHVPHSAIRSLIPSPSPKQQFCDITTVTAGTHGAARDAEADAKCLGAKSPAREQLRC